jgi:hypothetical protein
MDKQLLQQVERLRTKLNAAATIRQNHLHREVLRLSESLDELILQVQVQKWAKTKRNKQI